LNAALSGFQQVQTDRNGNIIFADTNNHVVSRLNADGTITVLAGNGIAGFSGEGGPARSASLRYPSDAVMDKAGNLYIYDSENYRIRRVTPDGNIATYAGTGAPGYTGDGGPALEANIEYGGKMAVDATGAVYFTDGVDSVVRRITAGGTIETYAGNGQLATAPNNGNNGPATKASLGLMAGGLAIDSASNLYIAEDYTDQIRKVAPSGVLTLVAGSGTYGFQNGPASSAQFATPYGITLDAGGNLFVADVNNGVVREVSAAGIVSTVAGTPVFSFSGDGGPALEATFRFPEGVTIGGDGNLYIEDTGNFRVREVTADGTIHSVAGSGQFESTPDGTPAESATLVGPNFISFDPSGRLLIADGGDFTVRRINSDGTIQTIAGTGVQGVGDGYVLTYGEPANQTLIGTPRQAVADTKGNIYISDDYAGAVYIITPDGILNVFAGQVGDYASGSDNIPATSSSFINPEGLALDQNGNLYISDPYDNRIRKVATNGIITTFAGTGAAGYSGDGGPANQAMLNLPQGIAIDSKGDLIIADGGNNRLRMVTPDGNISTIAGNGTGASTGNGGPATAASLNDPYVVATDSAGDIFLIETGGRTVRRISPDGTIAVAAGNGHRGFAGDGGPAIEASFGDADGLAVDSTGNLYVSDFNNNRVRVVLTATPTLSAAPTALSFLATSGGLTADPQAINVTSSLPGLEVTAISDSPWLIVPSAIAHAPGNISISVDPTNLAPGTYQGNVSLLSPGLTSVLNTVHVTFLVNSAVDPQLTTDVSELTFSLTSGGAPQSQSLKVLNTGSGQVDFLVQITGPGSAGLTASLLQGSTQPNSPATIVIAADPSKLPVGTTSASLLVLGTNFQFVTIPITITVSPSPQKMALSQNGFTFVAVAGGGVTPPQSFEVLATGTGGFSWTAQATTVSGGYWLSVSPDSGSSSSTSFGTVTVSANPAGLAPGVYYGLVVVSSTGTVNSPQQFEVVLNVLASQSSAGATAAPSGLIFTAPFGGDSPSSQTFLLTNLNATSASLAVKVTTSDGANWLVAAPDNGTIPAGGSQLITVQPATGTLAAGVYQAAVAVQVGNMPLTVNVLFVVIPSITPAQSSSLTAHSATPATCAATKLYPVFTSLTQGFVIPASWPLPIQLQVVDDCGNPMTSGQVTTDFSNGDPRLALASLQTGKWQGIWLGHNLKANQIVITANATTTMPALQGTTKFTGMLASNPNVPSVAAGGVTSGAGATGGAVVAPGDVITITGQYFAAAPVSATTLPLSPQLAGTEVLFGGTTLPLIYSSSGKILGIVPYTLAPNAQYELIVAQGGSISGPVSVTLGTAQPGILQIVTTNTPTVAQNLWSLLTAGTAFNVAKAGPATPLKPGESIFIYCTGLGAVNPTVATGAAAPLTPVSTVNTVTVSIGGQNVPVTFAGLVPGYPGIYQITGTVPANAPTGTSVPITVSVAGQTSAAVPVAVQ
jgi:uncharacterized protein (TIGR03437 family)